ncbi:unnamed protein product [Lymnaea stagnalis]|uniref:Uncharacterized protein n=1 Tax=Lymnaea stagnalis TaxID=6523 RepID=A0AAV2IQB8_LYMST
MTTLTLALLAMVLAACLTTSHTQTQCLGSLDIIFAVDGSNSMNQGNFDRQITSLVNLVTKLSVSEAEIHIGLVLFSSTVTDVIQLSGNKNQILQSIRALQYPDEQTRTDLAIDEAVNMFNRLGRGGSVPKLMMVITDGASTVPSQTQVSAARAKAQNITIFAVGVTNQVDVKELQALASKPEQVIITADFTTLEVSLNEATNRACVDLGTVPPTDIACNTIPKMSACFMGVTDLLLVVDVSNNAEQLSRFQYTGDFARVKNGITKMLEIILDPSVTNTGVRAGLVTYSDNFQVITNVTAPNSVSLTAAAVNNLPNGLRQGAANLANALRAIVLPPRVSDYRSYVAIIAPESSYTADQTNVLAEIARLKALGYTIVPFVIAENNRLDVQTLMREASGAQYFFDFNNYSQLEAALKNFTRDGLCKGYVGPKAGGLCDNSGHRVNGMSVVAHPMDCDKYVQCYYNNLINLDIGVVRTCPRGLHWNQANKTCGQPNEIRCPNDRCREDCEPYKMEGACGAYWDCENGVSTPKCCQQFFSFIPGVGCQLDYTCKDECGPEKWCGLCQKKPNWLVAAGYDVQLMNGNMGWLPRPCFYEDFDVVDCDCTAPRNQVCPADREYNFNDANTVRAVQDGAREGIRVSSVSSTTQSLVLNNKSTVHVDVNKMESGDEPFVIQFL